VNFSPAVDFSPENFPQHPLNDCTSKTKAHTINKLQAGKDSSTHGNFRARAMAKLPEKLKSRCLQEKG
jgi:hypothetical protein